MTTPYAIVILGKEPTPGTVKTRLAIDIGNTKAAKIQEILAHHLFSALLKLPYPIVLQLKGNLNGHFAARCRAEGIIVEEQSDGTLTDKIFHASQRAKRTLILGMDMPLISVDELKRAMMTESLVLGPAKDGGYWVIGGTDLPIDLLTDIPWSTSDVWESTVDKCQQLCLEYKVLSRQQDIDTLSDLQDLLSNPLCPSSLRTDLLYILNSPPS